ncbi:hypothetical protein [Streptomyces sp. IBSNAI001]|uniref:hypothetical protein n=1 Tax=Streptomyces sp. IBSNAI001 TaxID=3457499 RepID=UPI003FD372E1
MRSSRTSPRTLEWREAWYVGRLLLDDLHRELRGGVGFERRPVEPVHELDGGAAALGEIGELSMITGQGGKRVPLRYRENVPGSRWRLAAYRPTDSLNSSRKVR